MVSSPVINPDYSLNDAARLSNTNLLVQYNRATHVPTAPGSIFKPIVGLAALENGLDPNATIYVAPSPKDSSHGYLMVGQQSFQDTVPPGDYNFRRAIVRSSNAYFITVGLRTGIQKIIQLAGKFHLGQRMNLPTRQESPGAFPTEKRIRSNWRDGDSANIFFGQGEMAVTPMQMAVVYSAIANGGKVLWPRLVERIEPQDPASGEAPTIFPAGVVRDTLGLHPRAFKILYDAMLAETEDAEGTGRAAVVSGLRVCGKTGTAQVKDEHGQLTGWNYWFASFAPYENPRYAVVVMVQSEARGSGGIVCAPIAHDIYETILSSEKPAPAVPATTPRVAMAH
jgi:cell division protein FtsI/penicillin-binding protein 2